MLTNNFMDRAQVGQRMTLDQLHGEIDKCLACQSVLPGISKPNRVDRGTTAARVMFIGVGPGRSAAKHGKAFAGVSFTNMRKWFQWAGYDLDEDELRSRLYLTSLIKCRVRQDTQSNRSRMWGMCRDFLSRQIGLVQPELVVMLGKEAADGLASKLKTLSAREQAGLTATTAEMFDSEMFPLTHHGCRWLLMPHPSGLSRTLNDEELRGRVIDRLRTQLLEIGF